MLFNLKSGLVSLFVLLAIAGCSSGGGGSTTPTTVTGPATYEGVGTFSTDGGTVVAGDATIVVSASALLADVDISVEEVPLPVALPTGFVALDNAIDITVTKIDEDIINAPFKITLRYDDTNITDENNIIILHYNETTLEYEPVRIITLDTDANTIVFDSRTFSPFVLALIEGPLPETFDTGFIATTNGWNINNFGSYFSPGGNCIGMSGYAVWYHNNRTDALRTKYTTLNAMLVTIRAHLAQLQSWALAEWRDEQSLGVAYTGRLIKAYMSLLNRPLVFLTGVNGKGRHAMVVYKYDADKLYFYDVNVKDVEQSVDYNGTAFGTYNTYNSFGYAALASFGRTEDFADLTTEAEAGFLSSQDIHLISPLEDANITDHNASLIGSLSGDLNSEIGLHAYVKGIRREIPVTSGDFDEEIEISAGENTIILLAGVSMSDQSNWAKNGATLIRNVNGDFNASRMLVTLTWGQSNTDVDLYITEPSGETMWYANDATTNGLTLDIDDTDGYGPEHGTLTEEGTTSDVVLAGNYVVRLHYYSDHAEDTVPVSGNVNIVVNEGLENQTAKSFTFTLSHDDSTNDTPGSTGADWVDIATVDIINSTIN